VLGPSTRRFSANSAPVYNPRVKVLIVGGGGREHALAWSLGRSPLVRRLYCAPGNPGIARFATRVPIEADRVSALADFAQNERIDLTVVGPEIPLSLGLTDLLSERGLLAFGASAQAAEIESSKVFAKQFMRRHDIPTASFEVFSTSAEALRYLDRSEARYPAVIKADGLAAGKGVVIAADRSASRAAVIAMMDAGFHGAAGRRIVIEDCLQGREVSFFVVTDGARFAALATCQDYKRALDGDEGPNTGGMGAYSPSAYVSPAIARSLCESIVAPTLAGLAAEGRPYRGVLYVGLMLTSDGPRVIEYNARFGDPEAQVLLPRADFDLVPLMVEAASGALGTQSLAWRAEYAVTVVLASSGYPGAYRKGMPITGIEQAEALDDVLVFQAGTGLGETGETIVSGGRVLAVTALAADLAGAVSRAYEGVSRIAFDGMQRRTDIGRDAMQALSCGKEAS